jgi:hypothetical protein
MRLYGGEKLVVEAGEVVVLRGPTPLRLNIGDVTRAHVEYSDLHPLRSRVGHTAGALLMSAATTWHLPLPVPVRAAEILLLAGAVAAYAIVRRSYPRSLELWAEYRGADIRLYWSTDRIEFGRVARAVARALAASRSVPR